MTTVERSIANVFGEADARPFLHVRDIDRDREIGVDADQPVVTASVFKVPVMLELARRAAVGEIDLAERVGVPADRRTPGPTGLSVMCDDVDVSLRDLAYLMMSVSDNTATDVIIERLGTERIAATLESLGLRQTAVPEDCAQLLAGLAADLGIEVSGENELGSTFDLDPVALASARALAPMQTNRTTPREMTELLSLVWRDEAGPAEACAEVRRIMALQVWPHRLSSGFPDGVTVAGKTGTLPGIRNEVGTVVYPDGERFAVAVFTRARAYEFQQPAIDAAIGRAARMAVEALRAR